MKFNNHHNLEGLHAPFAASQSHWLRYDDDKVIEIYQNKKAAMLGTRLHEFAKEAIELGIKMPRSKKTLYSYINDAIGYKMDPEVVLFYSERFFGTADSISFSDNFLRIHDLKTGRIPADMEQLEIYAALFCLEYRVKPEDIQMELRLYQNDEVIFHNPSGEDIRAIMEKIIHLDKVIASVMEEE